MTSKKTVGALVLIAAWLFPGISIGAQHEVDSLAWMVGSWIERKEGRETEEHWIAPKGGLMLGVNRTVTSAGKSSYEFLRIAKTAAGISYFASPGGRPAVEFPLIESGPTRAVFENPKHDFPQRIIYELDGDALNARIEGTIGGQKRGMQWRWEKAK
jgi:hypothetical protein